MKYHPFTHFMILCCRIIVKHHHSKLVDCFLKLHDTLVVRESVICSTHLDVNLFESEYMYNPSYTCVCLLQNATV